MAEDCEYKQNIISISFFGGGDGFVFGTNFNMNKGFKCTYVY